MVDAHVAVMRYTVSASPNLSVSNEDGPISRTSSLGHSLSALAMHRIMRASGSGNAPGSGWRTPRERSQQRRAGSEGEAAESGEAPDRMSSVQEVEARIPGAQEKSGPDIREPRADEEAKKD